MELDLSCHQYNFISDKKLRDNAVKRMLITKLLTIWTAFPPSTGLPVRLAQNLNRQIKKRKTKQKGNKGRITASDNRRKRASFIFRSS